MRTFSLLSLGVLFVFLQVALRLGVVNVFVEAKQQCQLRANNQVSLRTSPITGAGPNTGTASTSSGSSTALPSPTPFNYGTDTIRGVNLCVFIFSSLHLRLMDGPEVDGLS